MRIVPLRCSTGPATSRSTSGQRFIVRGAHHAPRTAPSAAERLAIARAMGRERSRTSRALQASALVMREGRARQSEGATVASPCVVLELASDMGAMSEVRPTRRFQALLR